MNVSTMVRGLLCIFLLLIATTHLARAAQDGQSIQATQKAKAYYFAAESAYDNGQYDEALSAIAKVECLLGRTNPVLSALKIKVYVGLTDFDKAKEEVDVFYSLDPAEPLAREMGSYVLKIDKGIQDVETARVLAIKREEEERAAAIRQAEEDRLAVARHQEDLRKKLIPQAEREVEHARKGWEEATKEYFDFRIANKCNSRPDNTRCYLEKGADSWWINLCLKNRKRDADNSNSYCRTTTYELKAQTKKAEQKWNDATERLSDLQAQLIDGGDSPLPEESELINDSESSSATHFSMGRDSIPAKDGVPPTDLALERSADIGEEAFEFKEGDKTRSGWIGVGIQPMNQEIAEALAVHYTKGAIITQVALNSPADIAGLRSGDIIVKWGGENVDDAAHLSLLVKRTKIGVPVKVEIIRAGTKVILDVTTGELLSNLP